MVHAWNRWISGVSKAARLLPWLALAAAEGRQRSDRLGLAREVANSAVERSFIPEMLAPLERGHPRFPSPSVRVNGAA